MQKMHIANADRPVQFYSLDVIMHCTEMGKMISDGALVAITLMIAESNPEEKEIMVTLVMNLLKCNI